MTNQDQKQADTPRDRPFDPLRIPRSETARSFANAIRKEVEAKEKRQRARRPEDQETFILQIDTLVANLVHRHLTEPRGWLAISRSKGKLSRKDRYASSVMSKTLCTVIDQMAEIGIIDYCPGFQSGFSDIPNRQSTIRASPFLRERIGSQGLTLDDLGYSAGGEVIVLKGAREDYFNKSKPIQYDDSPTTIQYRQQVHRINDWLATVDIDFDECLRDAPVDLHNRRLRRVFNVASFEHGGRLFGGFWQDLSKQDRKQGLLINGNPVTTLDFGQIAPRIMYGCVQAPLHFEDAYLLPGLGNRYREGVKKVFNAMLHAKERHRRFPHGTRDLIPNQSIKVAQVIDAILDHHAPVANLFYSDHGLRVMFTESRVLLTILDRLMEQDIVGLPIHDALIVEEAKAPLVKEVMVSTFKEITGIAIPVAHDDE